MPKFSVSTNGENYSGEFDTVEEAIEEGKAGAVPYSVGELEEPPPPEDYWSAENWLEHVSCQDEYGGEWAEDWDNSTAEQRAELEREVQAVLAAWLDRHGLRPAFRLVHEAREFDEHGVEITRQPAA